MRTRAQAGGLDVAYVAASFALEEATVQRLLDEPTTELVTSFLTTLTTKAQQFDSLQSDKLKADVELENTIRAHATKEKSLKANVQKGLLEVEELRKKLSEEENARSTLRSELDTLKSSSTSNSSEVEALHTRISTLEASNRDVFALVESKSSAHDRLAEELSTQHQKFQALRREVNSLEEKNQSHENASASTKFKEQALQQEIELLKRNTEWHETELKARSQEHTKFRKEKNARISELQRANEDATSQIETLKRTETTLRQRLEDVQQKADDAFAKIQQLREAASKQEQDFRIELDSSRRLADLQKQNADTHKARLQELQNTIEQINEDAADEIGKLQAEVETERTDKQEVERKVADLEMQVERLESQPRMSRPGTPQRNGHLEPATPQRLGSRAGSPMPGSAFRTKVGGLTFTQLYSEYTSIQSELEAERRRSAKLREQIDEFMQDIEGSAPEMIELRQERDRLAAEILDFSTLLDDANAARDEAIKQARIYEGQSEGAIREGDILRQQLRDLSAQVKILLVEVQARDQGLEALSASEQLELERAARGELDDAALEGMSDTSRFISQRLTIFRNARDLQDQNAKLLRITRELGEKLEGDEAREKQAQTEADMQELENLRSQVGKYQDEMKGTETQIKSYMKERDMFRRMLQHRGQLEPDTDLQSMFGRSVEPQTPQRSIEPTPQSKDLSDMNKLLKEQQTFFDQYRQETATDRTALKQQVDSLSREKSGLQADLARASSQVTLAHERYEMLQSNFSALKAENAELQKRTQVLAENAAKQDLRTQQVAEELVEAKSMADGMRNETANLKAERELWKRIESRLTEDNRSLTDERSRLNKLNTDLQNLNNERELSDSETRRRLQSRTETLESELESVKRKLESETEESKKAGLRREYEADQNRTRINDLVKSLSNVREELVEARTTRDSLQARADEMKIELRSAEEKVQALQPRPTPRAEQPATNGEASGEGELSREQELGVEVSELRRDLELTRGELESANAQVEEYKNIAQSAEEDLARFNETSDQYREEMDQLIAERDSKVKELEQRTEDLSSELFSTNAELSEIRTRHESSASQLDEQKANFEAEIARINDNTERIDEERKLLREDLRTQAEIAQQAQQSYEDELLKHAEAAKLLQKTRMDYNQLRTEVAEIRADSEAAKATLTQNQESWEDTKERYEREMTELRTRREDVDAQNKILHQQLESFSSELASLRQGRSAAGGEHDASISASGNGLQEVIKYLRQEKEIVDVQYELRIQESKRLQQQLDYANSQLEDTRQKLEQERQNQANKEATAGSFSKLQQTLNELNLYRESNATLRNEASQAQSQLAEKVKEVENLVAQLQPIQTRVREVENELETKQDEYELLKKDRDYWHERTQNIISKYDRVDPAELEELKNKISELQAERDTLLADKQPLQEQVDGHAGELAKVTDELTKQREDQVKRLMDQAKKRDRERTGKLNETNGALQTAQSEQHRLAQELEQVRTELESVKSARDEAVAKARVAAQAQSNSEGDEEGQANEDGNSTSQGVDKAALEVRASAAEARAGEQEARANELASEAEALQARVQELQSQVTDLQQRLEATANTSVPPQTDGQELPPAESETLEHLERLKQDLATAQQEVENLRANATAPTAETTTSTNGTKSIAEQVEEQVAQLRKELEAQHELSQKQLEEEKERRVKTMQEKLSAKLKEVRSTALDEARQQLITEHSQELQRLRSEYEGTIQRLKSEHQQELERLSSDGGAAVQKAQAQETDASAVKAEAQVSAVDGPMTEEQAKKLIQTDPILKGVLAKNIRSKVDQQILKLKQEHELKLPAKIEEATAKLREEHENALKSQASQAVPTAGETSDQAFEEKLSKEIAKLKEEHEKVLAEKIEAMKKEKEKAITNAVELATKKQAVQINMAQGWRKQKEPILNIVMKAATETPERPVGEVWEVARVAKPPAPSAPASVPASSSPVAPPSAAGGMMPAQTLGQAPVQTQPDKLQQRQQRFGAPSQPQGQPSSQPSQAAALGIFGKPSTPTSTGAFGMPSALPNGPPATNAPLAQPARRPSAQSGPQNAQRGGPPAPNQPQAAATRPSDPRIGTGIPRAGSSNLPTARGGGAMTGRGGAQGMSIQGAAGAQRGGAQTGLPRSGGNAGRGRGRGGGSPLNAGAKQFSPNNSGQKRPHEGGAAGDEKRVKGDGE